MAPTANCNNENDIIKMNDLYSSHLLDSVFFNDYTLYTAKGLKVCRSVTEDPLSSSSAEF